MKKTYSFEKSFGPAGSFSGIVIFIFGLIATYYAITGLFLVLIGAFTGFTNSATTIDRGMKQVRFTNNLFGFIKVGKWIELNETMKLGAKKSTKVYRTHSLSDRTLDVKTRGVKIFLYDLHGKPIMPLKNIVKGQDTQSQLEEMSKELGLTIIKV